MATSAPLATRNVWMGRVMAGTFLGDQTEYRVRLGDSQDILVRRQNLGPNGSREAMAPGTSVYLSWEPEVSLLLPRPA